MANPGPPGKMAVKMGRGRPDSQIAAVVSH